MSSKSSAALGFLQGQGDAARDYPYVLALVANALLAIQPEGIAAQAALDRLGSLKQTAKDGKLAWWGPSDSHAPSRRTLFFGSGESRRIETTAVAALALLSAN